MSPSAERTDVLIVGAGLAGLTAARRLAEAGRSVAVVDKGRGVGGRMATRRITHQGRTWAFDHGAQFFTARDDRFAKQVSAWQQAGTVRQWSRGFPAPGRPHENDGHPRWIGVPGMTALAKDLAHGLDVRTGVQVQAVRRDSQGWYVELDSGGGLSASALLLTPPVPQSLALLHAGGIRLSERDKPALEDLTYDPCLALLVVLDGPARLPQPGGLQFPGDGALAWMAENFAKGLSPQAGAVTIHASPAFSRRHWQATDETVQRYLLAAAEEWLGSTVVHAAVKRWRYARPEKTFPWPFFTASRDPMLLLAGDGFGGSRLEGAFLSGLAAADHLLDTN